MTVQTTKPQNAADKACWKQFSAAHNGTVPPPKSGERSGLDFQTPSLASDFLQCDR